jgi:hypothetical protein
MDALKELNIPKEDCVIYGSAPMVLRGLKEKNNDLDVLVKDSLWEKLSVKYPNNINGDYIDINGVSFTHTDMNFLGSVDDAIRNSDVIDGYHILTLAETKRWKEKVGSEKHLKDAKAIEEYLNKLEKRF